ncbi:hypothetical protein K492DRAFT_172903 [Lichtheimia hyalospora FSU 10163]|nr:hypothetical protein K492DRAFT_172903 [Lichtheimia hyalospora FSU 10163]
MSTTVLVPSHNGMPRTLKWASHHTAESGNMHKHHTTATTPQLTPSSSSTCPTSSLPTEQQEIVKLESELTFTYDTLATINVMFDSLQHAYASSESEMERLRNPLRLSEKEKELLGAYDDLGLQVVHLERQIIKLEKKLMELKSQEAYNKETIGADIPLSTPVSSAIDTLSPSPSLPSPPIVQDQQNYFNNIPVIHQEQQQHAIDFAPQQPMEMMFTYENEAMAAVAAAAVTTTAPMALTTQAATGGVTTPMDEDPTGSSFFYMQQDPMFFDMFNDPTLYNLTCYNMDAVTPTQQYAPMSWSNDHMPQPPI